MFDHVGYVTVVGYVTTRVRTLGENLLSCPVRSTTSLQGRAGKSEFGHGRGENFQCMPNDPEYFPDQAGVEGLSFLHSVDYERPINKDLHDTNVPCAVCHVSSREAVMMIPTKLTCPTSWTKEYSGYLMNSHYLRESATFEYVDSSFEAIPQS